jgi:hypothetical protein
MLFQEPLPQMQELFIKFYCKRGSVVTSHYSLSIGMDLLQNCVTTK